MTKKYYYIGFVLVLFVLSIILIPNKKENIDEINFTEKVLYIEKDNIKTLPINIESDKQILFSYSNDGIVSINDLEVRALSEGHTKINGIVNNETVTSIDVYVIDLKIKSPKNNIYIGEEIQLSLNIDESLDYSDFDWKVSDNSIIKLNSNYVVKGLKQGKVKITVTLKDNPEITATFELTINKKKETENNQTSNQIDRLINMALNEKGYAEGTNGYTKYGDWYGIPYGEWCAMFVSWNVNKANISTSIIPKFASVREGKSFFESKGLFNYKGEYIPKRGDIIFFLNGISHTGIVTKVENGRVYVIEGNSKDIVAERNYLLNNSTITGYGTPNYAS